MKLTDILKSVLTESTYIDDFLNNYMKKGDVFIGWNNSIYNWEYDYMERLAILLYKAYDKSIHLYVYNINRKSGIGAGTTKTLAKDVNLGTLDKVNIGTIPTILKPYAVHKSSAGRPFKGKWTTPKGQEINVSQIVQLTKDYLENRK